MEARVGCKCTKHTTFFRGWIVSPKFSFPICQGAARDSSGSSTASISSARASWLASSLISNHQQFHQKTLENCQLSVKSRASILSFSFELKRVSPASIRSWLPVWTQKITLSNLTKNKTSIWWFEKSSKYENLKKNCKLLLAAPQLLRNQARCHFEAESWITVNSWQTQKTFDNLRHISTYFKYFFLIDLSWLIMTYHDLSWLIHFSFCFFLSNINPLQIYADKPAKF